MLETPIPERENLTEVFAIDQTIGMVHSTMERTAPSLLASSFLSQHILSMHIQLCHSPDALGIGSNRKSQWIQSEWNGQQQQSNKTKNRKLPEIFSVILIKNKINYVSICHRYSPTWLVLHREQLLYRFW